MLEMLLFILIVFLFFFTVLWAIRALLNWLFTRKDKKAVVATNNLVAARTALVKWIVNNRNKTMNHPEAQMLLRAELVTSIEFYKYHPSCKNMEINIASLRKAIKATP